MEKEHIYRVTAWWTSGQTGLAKSDSAPNAVHFAAPAQFGGMEGRWTPEDLMLSAVASCFTTTFQAIAKYSKFSYVDLQVVVEGVIQKSSNGYGFTAITIRPTLTIADEKESPRGLELLHKAKALCLVSRAMAVPQEFMPRIENGKLAGVE